MKKYCIICNKEIKIPKHKNFPSYIKYRKFCSNYCNNVARRINSRLTKLLYLQCDWCDKLVVKEKRLRKNHEKSFCNLDCHNKFMKYVKHDSILLKKRKSRHYGPFWGVLRDRKRKEQNYTCEDCGITEEEYGKQLSVHHIIPFSAFDTPEEANKYENLVGVCEHCHRKRHSGENHPSTFSDFGKNSILLKNHKNIKQSKKLLLDLLLNNFTYFELSKKYKLTVQHIRNINLGLKRQYTLTKDLSYPINKFAEFQWKHRNSTIDIDKVPMLIWYIKETDLTYVEIAKKFNITAHQVQEISYGRYKDFHYHELPLRPLNK